MVDDSVLVEKKEEEEEGGGMTKEEEEEEREAQELREWNAKNGTGSDGTGSIKSKEEWLKASKERREAQEALEGPINTHTNLDVCFLCAKPATSICEVGFDALSFGMYNIHCIYRIILGLSTGRLLWARACSVAPT